MRRFVRLACVPMLLLVVTAAAVWPGGQPTRAASPWSDPVVLFKTTGAVRQPILAADAAGDVHLIFASASKPENASGNSGALMYARLHQGVWSRPFDVLVSPDGGWLDQPAITVDRRGYLHVIWKGGPGSQLHYSRAHVTEASSATGWSDVQDLAEVGSNSGNFGSAAHIVTAPDDILHVVYVGPDGGVYHRRSTDGGRLWSSPATVTQGDKTTALADDPRISVDDRGLLQVAWTEFRLPNGWPPAGTFYARSTDDGASWSQPARVGGEGRAQINLIGARNGVVHRVWHATASIGERKHQWSRDGGQTWSPPTDIGPNMKAGLTGYSIMDFDSLGILHLVTATSGVQYVTWDGQWSSATFVSPGALGNGWIQSPYLAISRGNRLHVVYEEDSQRVWYTGRPLDAPTSPVQELPPPDAPRRAASFAPQPTPAPVEVASARASSRPTAAALQGDVSISSGEPLLPLLAGGVPALLLLGGIVAYRHLRRSRP